jgi:glycine/D-amino acid oxidase-like deaminating enzyme/nitrite reductase/ring-hydroxylating ferredoxin subunit
MQTSHWDLGESSPSFPTLEHDLTVDVVVVGAGVTGLTAAYLLKQAGLSVAVVEKERCGSGETYSTTAHLTYVTDTNLTDLVKQFGRDHAQAVWHAGDAALLQIDEIIQNESIQCDFEWVTGYKHAAWDLDRDEDLVLLRDEARLALELGFHARLLESVPLANKPGVRYADQAQFHPLKYITELARRIPGDGGYLFEHTEVHDLDGSFSIRAGKHRLNCDALFLATHLPVAARYDFVQSTLLQVKLAAFNTYAIGARLPAGTITPMLMWDTSDPYYYLRTAPVPGGDYVIFGGEDHRTGQAEHVVQRFEALEAKLRNILPDAIPDARWSGQVIESNDGLPFIGEVADRQLIATGFAGNGFTFGTLAAMMVRDALTNVANPWAELFKPSRTTLSGAWNYLQENMSYPYYMARDRLTRPEQRKPETLERGEGCVCKIDGELAAVYRNEDGTLTQLSPVCTHMGCFVHWNDAEQTWDCPCHGSRFRATGEVHAGPAQKPLQPLTIHSPVS